MFPPSVLYAQEGRHRDQPSQVVPRATSLSFGIPSTPRPDPQRIRASAISYQTPDEVEAMFNPSRDRRIHSVEELDEVLRESATRPLPFGMLYVAAGLEDEARRRTVAR